MLWLVWSLFSFIWLIILYILSFIYFVIKLIIFIIIALLFALWKHQGAILYQRHAPRRKRQIAYNEHVRWRTPAHYRIDFDDFFIQTQDGVEIHCWLLKQPNSRYCPTLVNFHGNADYRGYGNSSGVPTEEGLMYDGESILNHLMLRDDIDHNQIIIFGRSLGGAVAIELAYRCSINKYSTLTKNSCQIYNKLRLPSHKQKSNDDNSSSNDIIDIDDSEIQPLNSNKQYIIKDNKGNDLKQLNIIGVIIENTFSSILDMVITILDSIAGIKANNNNNNSTDLNSIANPLPPSYQQSNNTTTNSSIQNNNSSSSSSNNTTLSSASSISIGKRGGFWKYLRFVLYYFISNKWVSIEKVSSLKMPILYLSGLQDEIVPCSQMKKLYLQTKSTNNSPLCIFNTYPTGDHNSTWLRGGQKYYSDIQAFLISILHPLD